MRLHDDPNPTAVQYLIKCLYGFSPAELLANTHCGADALDLTHAKLVIDAFVAGEKYLVPGLSAEAKRILPGIVTRHYESAKPLTTMGPIIRHIYLENAIAAVDLRSAVVCGFAKHAKKLRADPSSDDLIRDVPEFAMQLVDALAEGGPDFGASQFSTPIAHTGFASTSYTGEETIADGQTLSARFSGIARKRSFSDMQDDSNSSVLSPWVTENARGRGGAARGRGDAVRGRGDAIRGSPGGALRGLSQTTPRGGPAARGRGEARGSGIPRGGPLRR